MYNKKTLNLFYSPSNVGIIQGASGVGTFTNKDTHDTTKIYIKVEDDCVVDAKFKTYSNVVGVAVLSVLTDYVIDTYLDEVAEITAEDILDKTGEIPQDKMYILDDAFECLNLAIKDYRKKQQKLMAKLDK